MGQVGRWLLQNLAKVQTLSLSRSLTGISSDSDFNVLMHSKSTFLRLLIQLILGKITTAFTCQAGCKLVSRKTVVPANYFPSTFVNRRTSSLTESVAAAFARSPPAFANTATPRFRVG